MNNFNRFLHWQLDLDNDPFGCASADAVINSSEREEIDRILLVRFPQTFTIRSRLRRRLRGLPCIQGQARQILGSEAILDGPSQGVVQRDAQLLRAVGLSLLFV